MASKRDPTDVNLLLSNIRELMKLRQGKEVIWWILSQCGIYDFPAQENTEYFEGRRSVGLDVIQLMSEADPEMYPRLLLEYARKEEFDAEGDGT